MTTEHQNDETPQQQPLNGEKDSNKSNRIESQQNEQPAQEQPSKEQHNDQAPEEQTNGETQPEQEVSPALATEGGREVSRKILYVGGLAQTISEEDLQDIFTSDNAVVQSVKILNDKNRQGLNYAFVEYEDEASAESSLNRLNGSTLHGSEININYAYQSQQAKSDPNSFNVFVGDLSTEVDDELLKKSFSHYESLSQAHVMWDMQSGRSRGYGFVSFLNREDAEKAIESMTGAVIANRTIRLNWASHKQNMNGYRNFHHHNNHHHHHHHNHHSHHHNGLNNQFAHYQHTPMGVIPNGSPVDEQNMNGAQANVASPVNGTNANCILPPNGINMMSPESYDMVLRKAPSWQTTVYLGNLARFTNQNDLIPLLQNFGFIVDIRLIPEKNCAFVKYDSHERAALAIVQLNGFVINGRPLKSGWGKDRNHSGLPYQNYAPINYGQGR